MKYADIKEFDVANGLGIRTSLFVSGCRHRCKGCFNSQAWDFNYGKDYSKEVKDYILDLIGRDFIRRLSILGGEPLEEENQKDVSELIIEVKKIYPEKDIWLYSGFTYEYIVDDMMKRCRYTKAIINNIDVLVDGKFDIEKKDLSLKFRGSSNQRLIDIKKTYKTKQIALL